MNNNVARTKENSRRIVFFSFSFFFLLNKDRKFDAYSIIMFHLDRGIGNREVGIGQSSPLNRGEIAVIILMSWVIQG